MKKRYLVIFLFLMFFGMNVSNAEEKYFFSRDEFVDSDQFGDFFTYVCSGGTSCYATCFGSGEYSVTTDEYGFCSGIPNIEKFRIKDGSIETTNQILQGKTCGNYGNCKEYILDVYCSDSALDENSNMYKLCSKINVGQNNTGQSGENDTGQSGGNNTGQCSYKFKYQFKSHTYETRISFYTGFLDNGNDLEFHGVGENQLNSGEDRGDYFSVDGLSPSISTGIIYYYPKNDEFNNFKTDFLNLYKDNNNTCPEICFVYDRDDTWYTTLKDKEYDWGSYAVPRYQCTNGGVNTSEGVHDRTISITNNTLESCEELFEDSPEFLEIIKGFVTAIKIAVPIVLILFGVLDFAKAAFSNSEDGMKKAQAKFIKRLLIAVCIFFVPSVLKLLLEIANSIWGNISTDFCGIL